MANIENERVCAICGKVIAEDDTDYRNVYYCEVKDEVCVCDNCLENNIPDGMYFCNACDGALVGACIKPEDEIYTAYYCDNGRLVETDVCEEYIGEYTKCKKCGRYVYDNDFETIETENGSEEVCCECYKA